MSDARAVRPLRLAFVKPDVGVTGGLELVVDRLEAAARASGWEVARVVVDAVPPRAEVAGLDIPRAVWEAAPEYFRYLWARDRFDRLDLRRHDVVVSTQPPSFAIDHPRHVSLFYHHHRVYYDLEEPFLAAGFAPDEQVHREAGRLVRELDRPALDRVGWFLAGSEVVARRLATFDGITDASVFHAGPMVPVGGDPAPAGRRGALCVGRLEFPKRTELVVAAAHLLGDVETTVVGTGGRRAWVESLDHRLATGEIAVDELTADDLWRNTGLGAPPIDEPAPSPVSIAGRLGDSELAAAFATATCVVAPALDEDYGLTAIEAMARATPVIVCRDGGGLAELVEDGRTGLVVDPTPAAIAAAVRRLHDDPDLATELGRNGLDRAAELSWDHAADEFRDGVERVLS
ncbi:MAG: glycosyltransferase family 4 protein [Acidimicrobiales bacterium]|nr:glycosyltransferase family 4 protein [Acidimicrobiales bacterium]MCB1038523.1 glycosyltransferase family 4 protein [Acidimicrobiales bacterium]